VFRGNAIVVVKIGESMLKLLARGALLSVTLFSCAAAAEPIKLKMAYFSSDREPAYMSVLKPFADAVNRDAKGAVEIEPFPGGVLGRNYSQQAQMVLDGTADLAWINPGLTTTLFPDNAIMEFPGLYRDLREATLVYARLTAAGAMTGYQDFFVVGVGANYPLMINTRPPIASLRDLRGKKLRVNNLLEGEALKALGVIPSVILINEVPLAISRGTIDGATMSLGALFAYGISRVTSFHYIAPLGAAPLVILMNRKKFESLPQVGQDAIRKYSGEWVAERFIAAYDANNNQALDSLKADPNRQVIFPPQAELDELRAVFRTVIEGWRSKSPRNSELLRLVDTEIARLRATR
jgi:TRAP-type C4-dicarboxylate transport system substrate-binding protein